MPAEALTVALTPIQDLHGYDKPWAGGSGKNKYKMTTQTETQNTVTVTANDDGTVNISRTGAATQSIAISLLGNQSELADLIAAGGTYTLTSNKGAYDINTFNVTISYKNSASATTNEYMKIGDTVTFPVGAYLISSNLYVGNGKTVDAYDNFALQLESGSSAASFAPYSNICPISGRTGTTVSTRNADNTETASATISFGQTVYGGQVDFKTGRVRVDKALVDLGSLDWTYLSAWGSWYADISGIKRAPSTTVKANVLAEQYETITTTEAINPSGKMGVAVSDGNDRIILKNGSSTTEPSGDFCYELATPTELTLTPSQLQMLKGYNSVTGDGVITITAYTGSSYPVEITRKRKTKKKGGK